MAIGCAGTTSTFAASALDPKKGGNGPRTTSGPQRLGLRRRRLLEPRGAGSGASALERCALAFAAASPRRLQEPERVLRASRQLGDGRPALPTAVAESAAGAGDGRCALGRRFLDLRRRRPAARARPAARLLQCLRAAASARPCAAPPTCASVGASRRRSWASLPARPSIARRGSCGSTPGSTPGFRPPNRAYSYRTHSTRQRPRRRWRPEASQTPPS